MKARDLTGARRRWRDPENGQATVEFAIILLPFLVLVGGIIYFGIGLNYWLDMNRVANQGARQAVVNNWPPQCPRGEVSCATSGPTTACTTVLATDSRARLQDVLRCQVRNSSEVCLAYPDKTEETVTIGDPVKVKLMAPYTFFFVDSVGITLTATATMRLEQRPSLLTPDASC